MKIDASWYERVTQVRDRLSAGGVVVRLDGEQMLVAVASEPRGEWVLPKGGVERGEDLLKAAMREIAEETGLTELVPLGKLGIRERYGLKKGIWIIQHFFLFLTEQQTGVPTDVRHTHAVQWFPLLDFPELFWPEQSELVHAHADEIAQRVQRFRSSGNSSK